jgi:hypothetical protein
MQVESTSCLVVAQLRHLNMKMGEEQDAQL